MNMDVDGNVAVDGAMDVSATFVMSVDESTMLTSFPPSLRID